MFLSRSAKIGHSAILLNRDQIYIGIYIGMFSRRDWPTKSRSMLFLKHQLPPPIGAYGFLAVSNTCKTLRAIRSRQKYASNSLSASTLHQACKRSDRSLVSGAGPIHRPRSWVHPRRAQHGRGDKTMLRTSACSSAWSDILSHNQAAQVIVSSSSATPSGSP